MTVRHHTLDIYRAEIHLVTTRRDVAALRRKLPWLQDDIVHSDSVGSSGFDVDPAANQFPVPHVVVWLDAKVTANMSPAKLVEVCAHEASHATTQLLEYMDHNTAGDEPYAYLAGWLTRWLWEACAPEMAT